MASVSIQGMQDRYRGWDSSRRLIFVSAVGLIALVVWAFFAQVDVVTRGSGRVIPSSKAQIVQPAEPATVAEILVRGGQSVKRGQLLVRLDDAESSSELGQLQTENERLAARAQTLAQDAGVGGGQDCSEGTICADERNLQQARLATARSQQAALGSAVEQ